MSDLNTSCIQEAAHRGVMHAVRLRSYREACSSVGILVFSGLLLHVSRIKKGKLLNYRSNH